MIEKKKVNQVQEAAGSCYSVLGANVPLPFFFVEIIHRVFPVRAGQH